MVRRRTGGRRDRAPVRPWVRNSGRGYPGAVLPGLDGVGGPPPAHRPRRYQRDDSRVCRLAGQLQTTPPVSGTSDRVRSSQANAFTSVCWRRARTWIHSTETDFAEEDTNCSRSTPLHRPARRSSARTIGPVIPAPPRRLQAAPRIKAEPDYFRRTVSTQISSRSAMVSGGPSTAARTRRARNTRRHCADVRGVAG